jgi:hypothetical protein
MKKSQQTYSENKTHTHTHTHTKRIAKKEGTWKVFYEKKKQSIVITKQRMLLIKVSNRMYCTWQKRIKTNTITTINMTKRKKKQRITIVCSWFYTGYEKKTKQLDWAEKRIHSDEKKKRERERELLRAHKTIKEKMFCFSFFFCSTNHYLITTIKQ